MPNPTPHGAASTERVRIMVVDDSATSRSHIIQTLSSLPSAETSVATSGAEALRAINQTDYSLILCDYEMPDMSGLQVLRFIRTRRSALELPVLMLTGREEADVKVRAFRAGANDYIAKSAQPEELLARVATQLELLDAQRRLAKAQARAAEGQRFEAVGYLAEALAHELNTPVQYIGDNLAFLADSFDAMHKLVEALRAFDDGVTAAEIRAAIDAADCDYLLDEVPRCVASSQQGLTRVSQIIAVMRDFGQRGAGEPVPQDLNEIVRGALAVSHGQWHNTVAITLDLAADLPKVPCVGASIKQVVLRAIINCVKAVTATPSSARRGDEQLEIRTRQQPEGWVTIEIADNGPELTSQASSTALEPVLGASETTPAQERAQALAFARSVVVDEHAGQVEILSRAPTGVRLIMRLPLSTPPRPSPSDA